LCSTQHPEPSIRQSALALLGDVAIAAFDTLLKPQLPTIMPLVLQQIELEPVLDTVSVCNNATWAVGEIALGFGNDRKCFGVGWDAHKRAIG
jgi:transportin-1